MRFKVGDRVRFAPHNYPETLTATVSHVIAAFPTLIPYDIKVDDPAWGTVVAQDDELSPLAEEPDVIDSFFTP